MSNNENPQRKTWVMYKKADTSIAFDTNIIPQFKALTTTDEHGTWTVSNSQTSSNTYIWRAFDHDLTKEGVTSYQSTSTYNSYTLLKLPASIVVSPEIIVSKICNQFPSKTALPYDIYVTGYNVDTGKWDVLTDTYKPPFKGDLSTNVGKAETHTDTVITTKQYYSQFRFYVNKLSGTGNFYKVLSLIEYQITKGRYKKI